MPQDCPSPNLASHRKMDSRNILFINLLLISLLLPLSSNAARSGATPSSLPSPSSPQEPEDSTSNSPSSKDSSSGEELNSLPSSKESSSNIELGNSTSPKDLSSGIKLDNAPSSKESSSGMDLDSSPSSKESSSDRELESSPSSKESSSDKERDNSPSSEESSSAKGRDKSSSSEESSSAKGRNKSSSSKDKKRKKSSKDKKRKKKSSSKKRNKSSKHDKSSSSKKGSDKSPSSKESPSDKGLNIEFGAGNGAINIKFKPQVQRICDKTDYPALCLGEVLPHVSGQINVDSVLEAAVKASNEFAKYCQKETEKFVAKPGNPSDLVSALKDCNDGYETVVENFEETLSAFNSHDIGTMRSMLSAVLTFVNDCEEELEKVPAKLPLKEFGEKLNNMTSNCLAITDILTNNKK